MTSSLPPIYPTVVFKIPLFSLGGKCLTKMCSTPQKQPAANVAISDGAPVGLSASVESVSERVLTRRHGVVATVKRLECGEKTPKTTKHLCGRW